MQTDLLPPHHHEAEQGALGSLLIAPGECAPILGRLLRPADFHHPAHGVIYETALRLWADSQCLDPILLSDALRKAGKLEAVGGRPYISSLIDFTPTAANCEYYAGFVLEASQLRTIWQTCRQVAADAASPTANLGALSAKLCEVLGALTSCRPAPTLTMREHVEAALERYEAAAASRGATPAGTVRTDLKDLDAEIEGGFHAGDLVIIAAETSGGKTALAMQAATVAATRQGAQVMIASYEMTAAQLVDRMIALASEVPSNRLRSGMLSEYDYQRIVPAIGPLSAAGIHLRDNISHWTVDDVAAEARAVKARRGLHLLVVDYLQLAAPRSAARGAQRNREREVAEISRALKGLAVELNVPVLALSQLNEDGRLRESRAIGQDADMVLIIGQHPDKGEDMRMLKLDKSRHGARDKSIPVGWNGPLMRFENASGATTTTRVSDLRQ